MKNGKRFLLSPLPTPHSLLPILLFSLLICTCDLFNGAAQPDYLKKIDDEIAWAKAAKLNVTIAYPNAWGISNPGAGTVDRSILDIRQGYAFDVEFTPDIAFIFLGWRVYKTENITPKALNSDEPEKGDWRTNTNLLNEVIQFLGEEVEVPEIPARGGSGSFTINTTEPLTLVPWCNAEPYVIRTEPRNEGESDVGNGVHPSTPIVIYFNSALKVSHDMAFKEDKIDIKARPGIDDEWQDYNDRFESPVYDAKFGQYFITIVPDANNLPESGYQIQVTVGPDILNAEEEPMSRAEVFYYSVSNVTGENASVSSWSASYYAVADANNNAQTIRVTYNLTGTNASSAPLRAYYQMNHGVSLPITLNPSGTTRTGTISSVSGLDFSGVRDGRAVSGSREYRIYMELGTGGDTSYDNFKIWNFPGMSVSNDNQAIELRQAAELAAIRDNLGRQYVLAQDITIPSSTPHTPIGNGSGAAAFTGKFYGNGKTVIINGVSSAAEMGLFGIANNAVIRDLTVQYSGGASNNAAFRFGGIAGTTQGSTQLINVLLKGSVSIGGSGGTAYTGGLVGLMTGTSSVNNAYSSLNLTVNANPGTSNSLFVGGIAGSMGTPSTGDSVKVEGATVVGDITVGNTAQVDTFSFTLNSDNRIPGNDTQGGFVGGLAGFIRGTATTRAFLKDSEYRQGTILVRFNTGSTFLGGAIGDAYSYAEISDCHALGGFDITKTARFTAFSVGGFIGFADADVNINSCSSNISVAINSSATNLVDGSETYIGGFVGRKNATISYCYAKGDVSIGSFGGVFVGGFLGYTSGNTGTTSSCYATGNVSVVSSGDGRTYTGVAQEIIVGGFSGFNYDVGPISHCYALGDVFVSKVAGTGNVFGGGFAGQITNSNTSNCFATGNIIAQRNSDGTINAGGFAGRINGTFNYIAALGESVTATGGTTRNLGRIYGTAGGTLTNSHAYNGMRLYWSATPGASSLYENTPTASANGQHGANANLGDLRTRSFWTNLGLTTANWDHVTVESRGYPILRGSDGRAMEGQ